ncbi:MAG TPA: beta-galactosidase, partial [Ktedonobacter sp.]|nr:beta-galactosidase [Ktedonobacter sp.]
PDSDLSSYKLVIAPLLFMLRPGVAQNLTHFVEQGGTLLVTYYSGIVNQDNHVMLGGYPAELRKLLGIHVEEFDPLTPEMTNQISIQGGPQELQGVYPVTMWGELIHTEGAHTLGVFTDDYYANGPALTMNDYGQGHAYYLATQGNDELLQKLTQYLCQQAGIAPVLDSPAEVEVTKRVRTDGREVYFLLNHSTQAQTVQLPSGRFVSLLDGQQVEGQIQLQAVDAAILLTM